MYEFLFRQRLEDNSKGNMGKAGTRREVVITNNGKPSALLFDIGDGDLEETLKAVRQAKAMMAFNSMRGKAAAKGYLSEEEIEAEIAAARQEE